MLLLVDSLNLFRRCHFKRLVKNCCFRDALIWKKCSVNLVDVCVHFFKNCCVAELVFAAYLKASVEFVAWVYQRFDSFRLSFFVFNVALYGDLFDVVAKRLADAAAAFQAGDPRDQATRVGPLITEAAARRAVDWIQEAVAAGAQLLCGGQRDGSVVQPSVLIRGSAQTNVWCAEAFAPLISLEPFDTLEEAVAGANSTPFGLSAGVFTSNLSKAFAATQMLRFGTVQINETSSARSDVMPFGGVKESGIGREGSKYGIHEFVEIKTLYMGGE